MSYANVFLCNNAYSLVRWNILPMIIHMVIVGSFRKLKNAHISSVLLYYFNCSKESYNHHFVLITIVPIWRQWIKHQSQWHVHHEHPPITTWEKQHKAHYWTKQVQVWHSTKGWVKVLMLISRARTLSLSHSESNPQAISFSH